MLHYYAYQIYYVYFINNINQVKRPDITQTSNIIKKYF